MHEIGRGTRLTPRQGVTLGYPHVPRVGPDEYTFFAGAVGGVQGLAEVVGEWAAAVMRCWPTWISTMR